ncbi:unnamed protein product [Phytophthora fragariaefolia]|uniref:Unnamed protein product n=1 Tax=Phytophthora fragariaefolia TaxID=1490495 RepID=A0A9W7D6G2_9STRA|nr:unnamed protein product [Phytophthora fragariaefolia]
MDLRTTTCVWRHLHALQHYPGCKHHYKHAIAAEDWGLLPLFYAKQVYLALVEGDDNEVDTLMTNTPETAQLPEAFGQLQQLREAKRDENEKNAKQETRLLTQDLWILSQKVTGLKNNERAVLALSNIRSTSTLVQHALMDTFGWATLQCGHHL